MNNTPATNASSSFVFLRFFIFVLPLFTAPIQDFPCFGVMGASGANIYQGGVIIMGFAPFAHRTIRRFADSLPVLRHVPHHVGSQLRHDRCEVL